MNTVQLQVTCMIYYFRVFGFAIVELHVIDTTIVILLSSQTYFTINVLSNLKIFCVSCNFQVSSKS